MADRDRRRDDLTAARRGHGKAGSAMRPLPGISAKIVDDLGNQLQPGPTRVST
ncbi:acetyl-coenzyme A synthetase domain protein [Mycobacterium xenopi 4042]|uniref:Acetyl-coenzyme A synthetase domain protein n=1 Tax=Mycobacterium xenopi 4042 TaxID=1299334 RepID=X8EER4_MYCXE|nr:acetyl-coenzyme A synthetase domain protein [Mycobacterium xenopi 4042]